METKTDKTVSLGEVISGIGYTDEEKLRISELLVSDKDFEKTFKQKAKKSDLFIEVIVKKIRIPGWSKGRPGYENQAINKVAKALKDEPTKCRKEFWDLYRQALSNFIIEDRPLLNNLVKSTIVSEGSYESSELLRLICQNAKEYKVTKEMVEEFYKLWMFQRVPNISELLVLCDKLDPIAVLNNEISTLKESVTSLIITTKNLTENTNQLTKNIKFSDSKISSLQNRISAIQETHRQFEESFHDAITAKNSEIDGVSENISKQTSQFKSRFTKAESLIKSVQEDLSSLKENLEQSINSKFQKSLKDINTKNRESAKEVLNYLDSKLDSKLGETNSIKTPEVSPTPYQSPLIPDVTEVKLKRGKIKTEWDFINIWAHHLKDEMDVHLSIESVAILHVLFKASNVLLVDHIRLFRCWARCLGWEQCELDIAASPSWLNEEDWSIGAKYLFSPDDINPRILAIHNYDVALTSCYLTPTLKLWSLKDGHFPCTKLVLIESGSKQTRPTPDILEFATVCPEIELRSNRTYPLFHQEMVWQGNNRKLKHTGVDPDIYSEWFHSQTTQTELVTDIDTIAELESVIIPSGLKKHYSIVRDELRHFFAPEDSIIVAAYHIILPWLSAEFDEETSNIFFTHLKGIFTNPLAY